MESEEQKLDDIAQRIENENLAVFPPVFEMYATLFSILVAVIMFIFPSMLHSEDDLYKWMLAIMPQYMWAFSFFIVGILKAVGLMIDNNHMRVIGLVGSSFLYAMMTVCYAIDFPSVGTVMFACMTVFAVFSISIVKHTSLDK